MPDPLELPKTLKKHWRVKIYDNERLEEPHLTIIGPGGKRWRLGVRDKVFLDPGGKWKDIEPELKTFIENEQNRKKYCAAWDAKHPNNPVPGEKEEDDGD